MYKTKLFKPPAFSTLSLEDRLFLYSVRHWARRVHQARKAGQGRHMLPPGQARAGQVEAHIDTFLRGFVEALPEAFVVQPPYCRCALQFHEATLMAVFQNLTAGNSRGAVGAVSDCMSLQTIDRLIVLLRPVLSEIELAVQELR